MFIQYFFIDFISLMQGPQLEIYSGKMLYMHTVIPETHYRIKKIQRPADKSMQCKIKYQNIQHMGFRYINQNIHKLKLQERMKSGIHF